MYMIKKLRNDNITTTIFIVQSISPVKERRGIIGDYLVFLETATLLGFGFSKSFRVNKYTLRRVLLYSRERSRVTFAIAFSAEDSINHCTPRASSRRGEAKRGGAG